MLDSQSNMRIQRITFSPTCVSCGVPGSTWNISNSDALEITLDWSSHKSTAGRVIENTAVSIVMNTGKEADAKYSALIEVSGLENKKIARLYSRDFQEINGRVNVVFQAILKSVKYSLVSQTIAVDIRRNYSLVA